MPVGYTRECETTISPFHGVGALPDLFVFQSDHPSAVRKELEHRRAACMGGEQGEWAQGMEGRGGRAGGGGGGAAEGQARGLLRRTRHGGGAAGARFFLAFDSHANGVACSQNAFQKKSAPRATETAGFVCK